MPWRCRITAALRPWLAPDSMARIAILGCGDIGCLAGQHLQKAGHQVMGLRRSAAPACSFTLLQADLIQPWPQTLQHFSPEYVIYAASAGQRSEAAYQQAYVTGVQSCVRQLSAQTQHLIFLSSTAVYGQNSGEWIDETAPTQPIDFRGQCLLQGETCLHQAPCAYTIVRLSGLYGDQRNQRMHKRAADLAATVPQNHWSNRMHRVDCARLLHWLIERHLQQGSAALPRLLMASDSQPVYQHELLSALRAQHTGASVSSTGAQDHTANDTGKRCNNGYLLSLGFQLQYPSYRQGYDLIGTV